MHKFQFGGLLSIRICISIEKVMINFFFGIAFYLNHDNSQGVCVNVKEMKSNFLYGKCVWRMYILYCNRI